MSRMISLGVLWVSPLVIGGAIFAACWMINVLRVGFAGNRNPSPVIAFGLLLFALHAGYVLAPWLYTADRRGTALCLMVPVALGAFVLGMFFASRVDVLEAFPSAGVPRMLAIGMAALCLIGAYAAPVVIMMLPHEPRT